MPEGWGGKLVSVIIPVYNAEAYVGEAIGSALAQTHSRMEVLVVDDGSTDGSAAIVKAMKDPRIRYFYQQNTFLAAARNHGLREARGEFAAFLDADDRWREDKLEKQLPLFSDSRIGLVYCGYEAIDTEGCLTGEARCPQHRGNVLAKLARDNFVSASAAVVRLSLLQENRLHFQTGRQGVEDWDLWLRLAEIGQFEVAPEPFLLYREHPGNMSKRLDLMFASFLVTAEEARCRIDTNQRIDSKERVRFLSNLRRHTFAKTLQYGHWLLSENRKEEARAITRRAFAIAPWHPRGWWGVVKTLPL